MIFYTNTGKWVSEIVKAFDIFDMRFVTTCAHASCISSQGDVAAPDIFAWACHMTPCRQSYEARLYIFHQNRPRWAPPSKFAIVTCRRARGEMRGYNENYLFVTLTARCHMIRPCKNIGRGDVSLGGDTRCVRACRHETHVKNVKCFHNFANPFACVRLKNHGEKVKNP